MPRVIYEAEPKTINKVSSKKNQTNNILEIATSNQNKLREIQLILNNYKVIGKDLKIDEIQSLDPIKVASEKAKLAYKYNNYSPILVEDTSLEIKGLSNYPGTYVNDFFSNSDTRKKICTSWLSGEDRSALARVIFAIFDGTEVQTWEGITEGKIAEKPVGMKGFGWDDIFIPNGSKKTFAQMSEKNKQKYSMRAKALKKIKRLPLEYTVKMLPEPFEQELKRVQLDKLQDPKAVKFAYSIESIENGNKPKNSFQAEEFSPVEMEENSYFTRFTVSKDTKSLGLLMTDVDRKHLLLHKNGYPVLWQMGPERRLLALAQRAEFFLDHQNKNVHKILDLLEEKKDAFPKRINRRSLTIEDALGIEGMNTTKKTISLKELGYKKISSTKIVSRTKSASEGLYAIIGKHPRSIYGVGSVPFVSGWRDVIVTGAVGHMLVFVHRNNLHALDFQKQIDLINSSKDAIAKLDLGKKQTVRAFSNIGAALGTNPIDDVKKAKALYEKAGVKAFRIYTINSDPRVIETAKNIRKELGDEIELFVGQVVSKEQCEQLIASDVKADGLIFGHGGGRQCTSATNGMALTSLEELYSVLTDRNFNETSVIVEGGIGSHVGALLLMGVDCILRNWQFANCVIEQGDLLFEHKSGKPCQPYHGSASAASMIIESMNKENVGSRLTLSGRTKNVEGTPGYIFYQEKSNSMAFYVNLFKHYAARTLADVGVENIWELREFIEKNNKEMLRIVSTDAGETSRPWGNK